MAPWIPAAHAGPTHIARGLRHHGGQRARWLDHSAKMPPARSARHSSRRGSLATNIAPGPSPARNSLWSRYVGQYRGGAVVRRSSPRRRGGQPCRQRSGRRAERRDDPLRNGESCSGLCRLRPDRDDRDLRQLQQRINGTPTARESHTSIWTGAEMVVWGGHDGSSSSTMAAGITGGALRGTPVATIGGSARGGASTRRFLDRQPR